jgi:hypothetical protein
MRLGVILNLLYGSFTYKLVCCTSHARIEPSEQVCNVFSLRPQSLAETLDRNCGEEIILL